MSKIPLEKTEMSELAWAREQLGEIAPNGYVKERIRDAALALKWPYRRVRYIWYDDGAVVRPHELRDITKLTGVEYGRQERSELDRAIARADTLLMGADPDFLGAFVDALGAFARAMDRSRTKGDEK